MDMHITPPRGFDFRRTLGSHGWSELAPFERINEAKVLRVLDLGDKEPVTLTIMGDRRAIKVNVSRKLGKADAARVERAVRHILRLDDPLDEFYAAVSADAEFAWIAGAGAGRLLRSPTVYEDLVKSIMTTNCSWSLTRKMAAALVNNLGHASKAGGRTFPTAEMMAAQPLEFYRDAVRAGYRAPYLKELADRVASGELEVESWRGSELPTAELKREMKRVKGVGDYAAENLLKLVGRYDVLALDSWVRAKFAKVRNKGRTCDDQRIARFYARHGDWRGLVLWCDMTRDWFDGADS